MSPSIDGRPVELRQRLDFLNLLDVTAVRALPPARNPA